MAKQTEKPRAKKRQQPAKKRLLSASVKKTSRRQKLTIAFRFTRSLNFTIALELSKSGTKKTNSRRTTKRKSLLHHSQAITTFAIIFICLVSTVYFGIRTFALAQPKNSLAASAHVPHIELPEPIVKKYLPRSEAVRLQIPSIELDTHIETIGQNADGTLVVPSNYMVAGWYHLGPSPGELGPAVIAGHVDSFEGPGVFSRLHELQQGQVINVQRADGKIVHFQVTDIQNFAQESFPTEAVYGNIDHAGLRLITCGGIFNPLAQRYTHNTVVFAAILE